MRLPTFKVGLAAVAALTVALTIAVGSEADTLFVAKDLKSPRGITSIGSQVLIAEQGTGRILRVSDKGTTTVIASGFPTMVANTPEGPLATGPNAVIQVGAVYYVTVGEGEPNARGFDSLYSVTEGGRPQLIVDFQPIERANNFDGGMEDGKPDTVVNPYDLVWDGKNGLFVSAAGANTIFHVSLDGTVKPYAIFPAVRNPLFPLGGPTMDVVPTGLAIGPDGALYVGSLTGFPFPAGGAAVYRMQDRNGDGDALDPGETTVFASGLTTVTDIAFDRDGSLLVAQFSQNMLELAPGNVVRVRGGQVTPVSGPVVSPTGLAVLNDGTIMVTQEFLGLVADAQSASQIASSIQIPGAPAAGGGQPAIRPPSTGDGGLADDTSSAWAPVAVVMALLATTSAVVAVRVKN